MMDRETIYQSYFPDNAPDWYWTNGLHDACITNIEEFEFPFDYYKYVGQKNRYDRNLLALTLNSSGAMFDSSVKEIRLFNYKFLSPDPSLLNKSQLWWMADTLIDNNDHYLLDITLQDPEGFPEDFTIHIKFERAEVIRC